MTARRTVQVLLSRYGTTYATEAGIQLRNTPQPLYQLLVLSDLLSARIRASVAVAAARALFAHGMRSPERMIGATWQQRVDALGEGGYQRYDERTATQLGDGAQLLLVEYGGDLRRLRKEADGDLDILRAGLRRTRAWARPVRGHLRARSAGRVAGDGTVPRREGSSGRRETGAARLAARTRAAGGAGRRPRA